MLMRNIVSSSSGSPLCDASFEPAPSVNVASPASVMDDVCSVMRVRLKLA